MGNLIAFLFLFWSGSAFAGEVPVIAMKNPVPVHTFGEVVVGLEKGDQISYQMFPTPKKKAQENGKLFFNGPPGTKYTILVTVVNFGEKPDKPETKGWKERFDTGQVEVTMEGDGGGGGVDIDPLPVPEPVEPVVSDGPVEKAGTTSLVPEFRAAWKKDPVAEQSLLPKLAGLYSAFADETVIAKYTTWGQLEAAMRAEAQRVGVAGKLINTQTAVAGYLTKYLPGAKPDWQNVVITEKARKSAKTAFKNVATALAYIK